jgi:hypothetical protein
MCSAIGERTHGDQGRGMSGALKETRRQAAHRGALVDRLSIPELDADSRRDVHDVSIAHCSMRRIRTRRKRAQSLADHRRVRVLEE